MKAEERYRSDHSLGQGVHAGRVVTVTFLPKMCVLLFASHAVWYMHKMAGQSQRTGLQYTRYCLFLRMSILVLMK